MLYKQHFVCIKLLDKARMSIIDHEIKDNNDKTKHNTLICLTMDVLRYNKTPQINSDSVNCLLSTWALQRVLDLLSVVTWRACLVQSAAHLEVFTMITSDVSHQ